MYLSNVAMFEQSIFSMNSLVLILIKQWKKYLKIQNEKDILTINSDKILKLIGSLL